MNKIQQLDRQYVWHPFTQEKTAPLPLAIVKGEGAYLLDADGKKYLDLISSWWVNLHGHAHPAIAEAIAQQARTLEQVIFAGVTHPAAVEIAQRLAQLLPPPLSKVFFSDDGSTSVEVALKMAYQYWRNNGETQRRKLLAFTGGYHGDTFGAMAVGRSSGFYNAFADLLFSVDFLPYPATTTNDPTVADKEAACLEELATYLQKHHQQVCALILEPLVQGAAGMLMCRPQYLAAVAKLVKSYGILLIHDEVMTGFGRTGTMFASEQIGISPDIICLSKGLTGGFLPLSVTVTTPHIYNAFLADDFEKSLIHGHSYTANPLGCAAALASLDVFARENTLAKIKIINQTQTTQLAALAADLPCISQPRICGTIAAFTLNTGGSGYSNEITKQLRQEFLAAGLILRPLGPHFYLMPPYCTTTEELERAYAVIRDVLAKL